MDPVSGDREECQDSTGSWDDNYQEHQLNSDSNYLEFELYLTDKKISIYIFLEKLSTTTQFNL